MQSEQQTSLFDWENQSEAPTALVILSGGQDSTTCLYWAKAKGFKVHAITFDYGQKHSIELESAKKVASMAEVLSHEFIHIPGLLKGSSPLVSDQKLAQYEDSSSLPGGIEKTFVPMRNQLFMTIAANRAALLGASYLITGVSEEDYGGYPDCRETFIESFQTTCNLGTFTGEDGAPKPLRILTPLMYVTKKQEVTQSVRLRGCYKALGYTHTSYDGKYPPTGKDHASLLRERGFMQANIPDPLVLRAWSEGLMPLPATPNYANDLVQIYLKKLTAGE